MILISHRGNLFGKNPNKENTVDYINKALEKGYNVEVDVRLISGRWFLGHDEPQQEISIDFLEDPRIWAHCKNLEALSSLIKNNKVNCFWHQSDDVALTSFGYLWAFPGKQIIVDSIAVLPEIYDDDVSFCKGICSDFIGEYNK